MVKEKIKRSIFLRKRKDVQEGTPDNEVFEKGRGFCHERCSSSELPKNDAPEGKRGIFFRFSWYHLFPLQFQGVSKPL